MKRVYYLDGTFDEYEATSSAESGIDAKTSDGWTTFIPWSAIKKVETIGNILELG